VHLDDRDFTTLDGVIERVGGVGVSARVDQDAGEPLLLGRTDPVEEISLMVALTTFNLSSESDRGPLQAIENIVQGEASVDLRLALPKATQIGTIEDEYL
jgi:hypothetical protein